MYKKIINLLKQEGIKGVFTLVSGSVLARIIVFLLTPLIARLYSVEDFGLFAIYTSVLSPFLVIGTGRYDMAMMIAPEDEDVESLMTLSFLLATILSVALLIITFFLNDSIVSYLKINQSWTIYLLPLSIIAGSGFTIYSTYLIKKSNYKKLSIGGIVQSVSGALGQIGFSYMLKNGAGLILGSVVGSVAGVFYLKHSLEKIKIRKDLILKNLSKYRRYPLFLSWSSLLDAVATQLPVLVITRFYHLEFVGYFNFSFKVLNLPLSLISSAVSQVLLKKVSDYHLSDPKMILPLIIKWIFSLVAISIPIFIVFYFWGEGLFQYLFGAQWKYAGELSGILIFAFLIRFVVSPLSSIFVIERYLTRGSIWQFSYFITSCTVLILSANFEFKKFIKIYVFHEIIMYSIYLLLIIITAKEEKRRCVE